MKTFKEWDNFKEALGKAVDLGETVGLSDNTINTAAEKIGTYLTNNIDPRNNEERLLKELWDAADDEDRNTLAKLVVKITDK